MMYCLWAILTLGLGCHVAGAEIVHPAAPVITGDLWARQVFQRCPEPGQTACPGGMGCCPSGVACTFVFGEPGCADTTSHALPSYPSSQQTSVNPGGPIITTSMSTVPSTNPGGPITTPSPSILTSINPGGPMSGASSGTSTTGNSTGVTPASSSAGQASSTTAPGMASLPSVDHIPLAAWIFAWITGAIFI